MPPHSPAPFASLLEKRTVSHAKALRDQGPCTTCSPEQLSAWAMGKLTQLRRDLQREADKMGRRVLNGLHWLLLKFQGNLDKSKKNSND